MKRILTLAAAFAVCFALFSCAGEKKSGAGRPRVIVNGDRPNDSTIWYDAEIGTRQRSYRKELQGTWVVTVMHRQQKAIPEKLEGTTISIGADSTFSGKTLCNSFSGQYSLKGTSIKFIEIASIAGQCNLTDKDKFFLKLLEMTVSAYSVTADKLLLRDGASNIVFECDKQP